MNNFFKRKLKNKDEVVLNIKIEPTLKEKKVMGAFMRLSLKDKISFIKQLSLLIKAGVPLFSSLHMIKKEARTATMRKVMTQVIKDVENGQYLATTLGKFRRLFGELTINIISVGEFSGNLSNNLDHLVLTLKKQQALRGKVISASIYPIFIIVATIAITVMLTVFFFPKVVPVLKSVNYDLPWTTKVLIFVSDSLRLHGILIGLVAVILIIAIALSLRIKKVRFWFDNIILYIPIIKKLVQTYNVTNICRTLGLLQNSGVGIVRAFNITANTTANLVYKKELNRIADQIVKGEKVSSQMTGNKKLFPAIMSQMISVGEGSGKLSETFLYVSDVYEEEMDEMTKNLSTVMEPMLLVFMGILVGFIAISIITPIYGITQHLNPR